jgi:hypothetical protein
MQYNHPILPAYTFLNGTMSFSHFCSSLGLAAPYLSFGSTISIAPTLPMVSNDATRLAAVEATTALQQCITDKMATLQAIEKKAAKTHARVRIIALLLEEEQASTTALEAEAEAEAAVATLQLAPTTVSSSSAPLPPPSGGDAVVAMIHVLACRLQNIHFLVSTILNPSSTCYAYWHDQVLLTLKCYELADHILFDTPPINDPA